MRNKKKKRGRFELPNLTECEFLLDVVQLALGSNPEHTASDCFTGAAAEVRIDCVPPTED